MLNNLTGNALKYTPEGGKIILRGRFKSGQVILQVADTGAGIPPVDQPYVFEKFYRASNVPENLPGSGLGLAIVKSIVDNHAGRIWVESESGAGTTFTVVLPAAE
jgi:signal transduction histidine kinase